MSPVQDTATSPGMLGADLSPRKADQEQKLARGPVRSPMRILLVALVLILLANFVTRCYLERASMSPTLS